MSTDVWFGALAALAKPPRRPDEEGLFVSGNPELDTAVLVLVSAVGMVVLFGLVLLVLRQFLFICRPNEILVFSGRRHKLPDGTVSGFKILRGGRGLRLPFLEMV